MAVQVQISEKSPSPQPFIESENMTTIDLNKNDYFSDEIKSDAKNKPTKNFKAYNIIKSLVVVIGLFILLGLCITILILLIHRGYSKNMNAFNESAQIRETSFEVLFSNKHRISACRTSKSFEDCCYIFYKATEFEDIKKCTVQKVLNLFLQYELEANRRSKRQNYYDDVMYDEEIYPPDYHQEDSYDPYDKEYPNNFDTVDNYYQQYNSYPNIGFNNEHNYYPEYHKDQQENPQYSDNQNFQSEGRSVPSPEFDGTVQTKNMRTFNPVTPKQQLNYQDQTTHPKSNIEPILSEANSGISSTVSPKLCLGDECSTNISASSKTGNITNINAELGKLKLPLNDTKIKLVPETRDNERITDGFDIETRGLQTQIQTKQANPCFYPVAPMVPAYGAPPGYNPNPGFGMLPINSNQQSLYVINPPLYPSMSYSGYNYPNPQNNKNAVQVTGKGGQYYLCNPVSMPTIVTNLKGVEVRHTPEAFTLQDLLESMPKVPKSNRTREALDCAFGTHACSDNSKCIHDRQLCDNEVNCDDASDETDCSCKKRVGEIRWCDGYLDCPNGEDEEECFDCSSDEISCDDWSRFQRGTCVPRSQKCDGIKQCEITGKDEEDCSILTDRLEEHAFYKVSNAAGFLHRNYKGKWYPTCFGADAFSLEVCRTEAGPTEIMPRTHLVQSNDNYPGPFLDLSPSEGVTLADNCMRNKAAYVECPPLYCGLRLTISNPFRTTEVDTSAEEFLTRLRTLRVSQAEPVLGDSRVVGGKPSQPTAWPWAVSIYKNGVFHCGGVLINELWILTAAHCVDRFWVFYYEIQAGILRRFSYSPMEQTRWAAVAIPHEDYNKKSLKNDIALIKLSKPVRFNRYVRPICLPSEATAGADFLRGPKPNTICITVGWGATVEHGTDPDHLREVGIPILSHCKHTEDKEGDEICAGLSEGGRDACQGDSGGPLMCQNVKNRSQWYLAGIVSHGEGCARPEEPGVYTKVSKYLGWISENINGKSVGRFPLQKCPGYVCVGTRKCVPTKRHCDKIVDCLFGDDETDCWQSSNLRSTVVGIGRNVYNYSINRVDMVSSEEKESVSRNNFEQTLNKTLDVATGDVVGIGETKFLCKNILHFIPLEERCDKVVDCEDGTDESNCSCVDYLLRLDKGAKCDGIIDCKDMSDEADCVQCSQNEYLCRISQKCIPLEKRCDGQTDCTNAEDEWDCVALTDGKTLVFDSDLRPKHSMKGIITINRFGVWRPLCTDASVDDTASIATNVCNLLGFEEYTVFHKLSVADKPLNVTIDGFERRRSSPDELPSCNGLFAACANMSLDDNMHELHQDNFTDREKLYTFPWNAVIFVDGEFRCTGTIVTTHFIITAAACFQNPLKTDGYVTALLGKGKAHLDVEGPHDQIVVINEMAFDGITEVILFHTQEEINFNRYVKPARITAKSRFVKEQCVGIGFQGKKSKVVVLQPEKRCSTSSRCFETSIDKCEKDESGSWNGIITCTSRDGWYTAAVYSHVNGPCDFSNHSFPAIPTKIAMDSELKKINSSECHGFRCTLGQCIESSKVCDKIPDCRSGEDEEMELCSVLESECHLSNDCTKLPSCELSQFRCPNGTCIEKNSFCDHFDDCGDGSDEPKECSCVTYLETVHPEKICDGIINCYDTSDENSQICKCQSPRRVPCSQSDLCIAEDMVCDGKQQCPDGSDESLCYSLKTNLASINSGEVLRRTAGVWHSGCFARNHTTTELEEICKKLGFSGMSGRQLEPPQGVSNIAKKPYLDVSNIVYLYSNRHSMLRLPYRKGNRPYMSFIDSANCYKLFIECV